MYTSSIQCSIYPSIVIITDQVKDSFKVNSIPQVFLKWFYFLFCFSRKGKNNFFFGNLVNDRFLSSLYELSFEEKCIPNWWNTGGWWESVLNRIINVLNIQAVLSNTHWRILNRNIFGKRVRGGAEQNLTIVLDFAIK